jgi:hypothetical protein
MGMGVVLGLLTIAGLARRSTSIGKIEVLPDIYGWMQGAGQEDKGNRVVSARFKFANRRHTLLAGISGSSIPMWQFMALTNDGAGTFVAAFEPTIMNFGPHDDGHDHFEFTVHDARLLSMDWKVRVIHRVRYNLMSPFSSITRKVETPLDVWESDVQRPLPPGIIAPFGMPDSRRGANEQPAFLTNGGAIFREHELHYTP